MRGSLLAVALALFASSAWAGPKEDAEASLALARALQQVQADEAAKGPMTWEAARRTAKETGKPILVRVGDCDCAKTCSELRPGILTAHVSEWKGSAVKRMALVVPGGDGSLWFTHEWLDVPNPEAVRSAIEEGKRSLQAKPSPKSKAPVPVTLANCPCGCGTGGDCDCAVCDRHAVRTEAPAPSAAEILMERWGPSYTRQPVQYRPAPAYQAPVAQPRNVRLSAANCGPSG